jgi:hypothetical protein
METVNIYKNYKIEDFLKKFNLSNEFEFNEMINKIRYEKTNAMKFDVNNGIVDIKRGAFKGNKAKVLSQCETQLKVLLLNDKYDNVVTIDLDDISYDYCKAKVTYVLE